jgi:hypothetical protein
MNEEVKLVDEQLLPMTSDQMTERYLKIKAVRDRIEEEYQFLREKLLEETKKLGVISLKTEKYTITRQKRNHYKIYNHDVATDELEKFGVPVKTKVVLDEDYMKPAINELISRGEMINGIESGVSEFVTVRVAKSKK